MLPLEGLREDTHLSVDLIQPNRIGLHIRVVLRCELLERVCTRGSVESGERLLEPLLQRIEQLIQALDPGTHHPDAQERRAAVPSHPPG